MFTSTYNRGFVLDFENGVTISVQYGHGNYCAVQDLEKNINEPMQTVKHSSETAEVIIMLGDDSLTEKFANEFGLSCDGQYMGWVSADTVADAITWARNYGTSRNGLIGVIQKLANEVETQKTMREYNDKDAEVTKNMFDYLNRNGYNVSTEMLRNVNNQILIGRMNESENLRMIAEVSRKDKNGLEEYEGEKPLNMLEVISRRESETRGKVAGEFIKETIRELDPTKYSTANPLELKFHYDYLPYVTHGRIFLGEYQDTDNRIAILDFDSKEILPTERDIKGGTMILEDINKQRQKEISVNLAMDVQSVISKIEFVGYDLLVYLNVEGKEEDEKVVFPLDSMTIKRILSYVVED
ncbi:hypothetical protein P9X10_00555 [Bacillus cereus]|nr:hypothetical protein [Bacillus cereus]